MEKVGNRILLFCGKKRKNFEKNTKNDLKKSEKYSNIYTKRVLRGGVLGMKTKISIIATILVLTIITSYSVQGTYARYSTSVEGTSTARVAKWDLEMEQIDVDLFENSYYEGKTADGKYIIAPGTKGEYKFQIVGRPETSYKLTVDIPEEEQIDTIGRIRYKLDDGKWVNTIRELRSYIRTVYNPQITYQPGKMPSWDGENPVTHTIYWEWVFSESDELDVIDTDKGKRAVVKDASGTEEPPRVKFTIKAVAEQVD